jgi:SAM-dependent methyltransferase
VDPLAGSPWSQPETVDGFVKSLPNETLVRFGEKELRRVPNGNLLDLGCGAGRNAVPLARMGWNVFGIDLSLPMLRAAAQRALDDRVSVRLHVALAPMDRLPVQDKCCDLVVAHGIWNLARSAAEFRQALGEAARAVRPGAGLFVFTFSRQTVSPDAEPVAGEPFVFTQFSGQPQCFLTQDQLVSELAAAGFAPDASLPIRELNRPPAGALRTVRTPVIYEGVFRYIK